VVVSSRKQDGCAAVADAINEAGGEAVAIACHIGDMDALNSLFTQVEQRFGRLDVLVNNAATNPYYGHILDTDLGAFQKTVDVNIRGYFFASVLAGRLMRASGRGSIINVASVNAVRPGPLQGIYSITKGALLADEKQLEHYVGDNPLRRIGEPQDLAGAAVFLASDASSYVTGELLVVDGGFLI
jgi:NAD(P)-dependent dehydrogenase (short-subunit alcohol dehydrogenase family)